MFRFVRSSLLAAATTALVACGGGDGAKLGGGKEGAAKALFSASQPAGMGGQKNGQSLMRQMAAGAATGALEFSVDCAKGGSVTLKLDLTTTGNQAGSFKYDTEYKDCTQDGVNSFDGKLTLEYSIEASQTSVDLAMRLKGKLEISGDIDDYLDADITETFSATDTGATSGTVRLTLDGTIKTSQGSYTYANESLSITLDGGLPADDSGKS
ncbi:hypothetical protein [Hyalangium versicolor]|uniref:hypothetical protein n=1 Tax=Hyalangium versicolor TaxID=2861190 RepID=UPI001CCD62C2|nr:hypothetical protein [Hyalangium versicolor]